MAKALIKDGLLCNSAFIIGNVRIIIYHTDHCLNSSDNQRKDNHRNPKNNYFLKKVFKSLLILTCLTD